LPHRVAYYLCDYWPSLPDAYVQQFQNPASHGLTRLPKQLIGRLVLRRLLETPPVRLQLEHPICVSRAVRDLLVGEGVPVDHARIIQGGIQIDDFRPMALPGWQRGDGELKMLYAGRLAPEKGVHTAIRALAQLSPRADRPVTLDIVGNGERRDVDELRRLMRVGNLANSVHFRSGVPRSAMPRLLASYDALLFPSEWQEPFGRMVMEAMAVGLVVIGTTTGGTGDVLVEGETGLTFAPGDSATLARQIERLRDDRALGRRLATTACAQVSQRFSFDRMVDEIEAFLGSIASIEIAS
jgi:glycogen(starch) synthase